jgi:hypothetical protein
MMPIPSASGQGIPRAIIGPIARVTAGGNDIIAVIRDASCLSSGRRFGEAADASDGFTTSAGAGLNTALQRTPSG